MKFIQLPPSTSGADTPAARPASMLLSGLAGLGAVDHVPVRGTHGDHVGDAKVLVHHVERRRAAAATRHGHASARLERKLPALAVEDAVEEGQHAPGRMCVVDGRAKDEAIRLCGLLDKLVHAVVIKDATAELGALAAAHAVARGRKGQVVDLGVYALLGKRAAHLRQSDAGVSLGADPAVEHEDPHLRSLSRMRQRDCPLVSFERTILGRRGCNV